MNCRCRRSPILLELYQRYLLKAGIQEFEQECSRYYSPGTLERLLSHSEASVRRAAVLALGLLGNYSSVPALSAALRDEDRTVSILAENTIRTLWNRDGNAADQQNLQKLIQMNAQGEMLKTITFASLQLQNTPGFAEVWHQRALAWFELGRFEFALDDLLRTLELNPHHFNAYVTLGYVYMELGRTNQALHAFHCALELNPGLKYSRTLKRIRTSQQRAAGN